MNKPLFIVRISNNLKKVKVRYIIWQMIRFKKKYLISCVLFVFGIIVGVVCTTFRSKNEPLEIVNNSQISPLISPTISVTEFDFSNIFIKQKEGVETKQTIFNPFSKEPPKSNISQQEKTNQKYEINEENEEKEDKLFNTVYLNDKTNGNKIKILDYQVRVYRGISSLEEKLSVAITQPDEIAKYPNGPTRKIYGAEITPDDKHVLIATEDAIYVYDIGSSILTKVYDQNTPENIFPLDTKYKMGYDYCYKPPFVFSPDYSKVYLHKCMWEGSSILVVDLENKTSEDPNIPVGFGSQVFGWADNKNILFYDIHMRENKGLYMLNTDSHQENLLLSLNGSIASASYIDGYIYFANYETNSLDLYKYDLKNKTLFFIKRVQKDDFWYSPQIYIWKDSNNIIWDYMENQSIYRFVYNLT